MTSSSRIKYLRVLAHREQDATFARMLSKRLGTQFLQAEEPRDAIPSAEEVSQSFIVLGLERFTDDKGAVSPPMMNFMYELISSVHPSQIMLISDEPIFKYPGFLEVCSKYQFLIQYSLIRGSDPESLGPILSAFSFGFGDFPGTIEPYLSKGAKLTNFTLQRSGQRNKAIAAVDELLHQFGMPPRMCSRVSQGVDELIMNAIYDAPRADGGRQFRKQKDRNADFLLNLQERVEFELGWDKSWLLIQVSDHFGSLDIPKTLQYVQQNYRDKSYHAGTQGPSAGLGLNGILDSGISMATYVTPGKKTEAILIVPRIESMKQLQSNYQLSAFFKGIS